MTNSLFANQLRETAGVSPSWHFLQDCCAALGNAASVDSILQQILHHDLRDVVRVLKPESAGDVSSNSNSLASIRLRKAISDSLCASTNHKTTLPDSFRLLVQVEELLDMTLGIEARHSVGLNNTAGNSYGNHASSSASRCLKLLLSDGYYADGRPIESAPSMDQENRLEQSQRNILVGMEMTPIPLLSATSLAGIKVLLKGPILVRHGMLQVHAGNLIVLGGHVPRLIDIQKQAVQQAQRLAGVDPTIRALIGPEGLIEPQDDEDEGEGESSDIPPQGPRPPAPLAAPNRRPPATSAQSQQLPRPASSLSPSRLTPPNVATPLATTTFCSNPSSLANINGSGAGAVSESNIRHRPASVHGNGNNPYAYSASATFTNQGITEATSTYTPPGGSQSTFQHSGTSSSNPYARSTGTSFSVSSISPVPASSQTVSPALSMHTNSSASVAAVASQTAMCPSQNLSFGELQDLLVRIRSDEALYRQHYDRTFTTLLQQDGVKLYFNIEKKKKDLQRKDDKKEDKYEYAMYARFKSPGFEELVTCKIASSILEPFFGARPGDMRKMNREDKDRANDKVKDGGRKVQEVLNGQHYYDWTLALSPSEFFASNPMSNGNVPVLLLHKLRK